MCQFMLFFATLVLHDNSVWHMVIF